MVLGGDGDILSGAKKAGSHTMDKTKFDPEKVTDFLFRKSKSWVLV